MKVSFVGSDKTKTGIVLEFSPDLAIVPKEEAEIQFVEITGAEILAKLPKTFAMPTYFILNTKEKSVIEKIKVFKINGLFFVPLKKDDVLKKLKLAAGHEGTQGDGDSYDIMRAKIIAKAENIPALPDLARDLVKLTRQDNSQLKDFVEKIKQDQGLSSKIIKLVNSPFYGLRKEVASIDRATVLLGVNTVKNLALAVSTELYYNKNFAMYKVSGQKLWEHCFAVARLCEGIAKLVGEDEDSLYLAGLMHDMGKTILVDFLVKEVSDMAEETEQLGINHAEVGELILNKWAVAKPLTEAVRKHHERMGDKISQILYFANLIEIDEEEREKNIELAAEAFNIDSGEMASVIGKILSGQPEDN